MSAMLERLSIIVDVDAKKARRELDSTARSASGVATGQTQIAAARTRSAKAETAAAAATGKADKAQRGSAKSMGLMRGGMAGMVVQTAGILGIAVAAGRVRDEFTESEIVGKRTAQVIDTMGAASWTTSDHVTQLSQQLSTKTAIDDEQIQSQANLLLTFGKVRNEAGKGNDIFDQAVGLSSDLAEAMGMSGAGAAKMLGKALNDPVKGMTAMTRAGVSFTKGQQEQIKSLVKSGDSLTAQKLIMQEVAKQVGGAAAGAKTPAKELDVALGNLAEEAGTVLMPAAKVLSYALVGLTGTLTDVIQFGKHAAAEIRKGNPAYVAAAIVVGSLTAGFVAFRTALMIAQLLRAVQAAVWAVNAAMIANPVGLVIAGLVALGVALVIAYKKVGWFRDVVNFVWAAIKVYVGTVIKVVVGYYKLLWTGLKAVGSRIGAVGKGIWDGFKGGAKAAINAVIGLFNTGFDAINSITPGELKVAGKTIVPAIPDIPHIPEMKTGGVPVGVGSWITGEAGPEIATRDASGRVQVSPLSGRQHRRNRRGGDRPTQPPTTNVYIGTRSLARELTFVRQMDAGYSHGQ